MEDLQPCHINNIKSVAPGEARTHGLQIMRLTRCLLRYGGVYGCWVKALCLSKWKSDVILKIFVRRGIRTPALIRGPEISTYPLPRDKALALSLAP